MAARGHPRDWVAQACARYGEETVLGMCGALLGGRDPDDVEIDLDLLGGPGGARLVRESDVRWLPRSWAARAMRYVWCEGCEAGLAAQRALVAGLHDAHWHVRETSAAVVAVREVGAAAEALLPLLGDDVPRVRAAAARAIGAVGEHEHLGPVHDALDDPDAAVAEAARRALARLSERLDL